MEFFKEANFFQRPNVPTIALDIEPRHVPRRIYKDQVFMLFQPERKNVPDHFDKGTAP
jgi:hypothetical protein